MKGTGDAEDGHKGPALIPVSASPPDSQVVGWVSAWLPESCRLDSDPGYTTVGYMTLGKLRNPSVLKLPYLENKST